MRVIPILFSLLLSGCSNEKPSNRNGLSVEWIGDKASDTTILLVKRNGVVISEVGAFDNTFSVTTRGSDEISDLYISYHGEPEANAERPTSFALKLQEEGSDSIKMISFNPDGEIVKTEVISQETQRAQQGEAPNP